MLVDPNKYPGPALWQGIMLIAAAIWTIWLFSSFEHSGKALAISVAILGFVAITSMILIIKFI